MKNLLVIPDAYPLKRPELRDARNPSLADFAQETFLTLSEQESSYITPLILHSCAQAGFVPQLVEAPTFETLLLWLELGRGLFALNEENMIYRSGRAPHAGTAGVSPDHPLRRLAQAAVQPLRLPAGGRTAQTGGLPHPVTFIPTPRRFSPYAV